MFRYASQTKTDVVFKPAELLRTLKAGKQVKSDANKIAEIKLSHTLSPQKTNTEPSANVKEIYIVDVSLATEQILYVFLEALDRYIEFQVLFRLFFGDECKYLLSLKTFDDDKMKIVKTFETPWQTQRQNDFPVTGKLELVFREMVSCVSGVQFRSEEDFSKYARRCADIKRLQTEIQRKTKLMFNEKQPNLRMRQNDEIKLLKKTLAALCEA